MSSGDPSLVDTPTLLNSMRHDFSKSNEGLQQFFRFFHESQATLHELLRRSDSKREAGKTFYHPRKAGPRPEGKRRHFICEDCGNIPDCPMLEDETWYKVAEKPDLLCIPCVEARLGRPLQMTDLLDCPGNAFAFLVYDRLIGNL